MSWIKIIEPPDADSELDAAYSTVGAARGTVANILKVHSIRPRAMTAHLQLYRELMFGKSELSRREREMIGVAVSAANACYY